MSWIKKVFTDFQTVIDAAFLNGIQDQIIADETTMAGLVTGVKGNSEASYRSGNVNITKANVGLGNVDNTSDAQKPVSNATQEMLDSKVDKVTGKGLSTNDYTNAEKQRVADSALQTDLDALDDRVDQIYNGGLLYDTASGSVAFFDDGADNMPIKSLVATIEPVQDLHGYDSPWPAGGGKNLLPYERGATDLNGIAYTPQADGGLKVQGTLTSNSFYYFYTDLEALHFTPGETYRFSLNDDASSGINMHLYVDGVSQQYAQNFTFEIPSTATKAYVRLRVTGTAGETSFDEVVYPMVMLASNEDTSWVPYSNICPITGWTGLTGARTGKNLLDEANATWVTGKFINADGEEQENASYKYTSNYYPVSGFSFLTAGITRTGISAAAVSIPFYNKYKQFVRREVAIQGSNAVGTFSGTVPVPADAFYFRINMANSSAVTDVYVEAGAADDGYTPYTGTDISVNWQSTAGEVFGGMVDVISGKMVVDRASIDLGSQTWSLSSSGRCFSATLNVSFVRPESATAEPDLLCSCYGPYRANSIVNGTYDKKAGLSTSLNQILIRDSDYATAADFKESLTGQTAVVRLATPIEYQLTPQEVTTLLGTNHVWTDVGPVEVTYPADTKLFIEKLTQPTEDDMTADHAIASGTFFQLGNTLYLATAAIAAGATITPGTNATKLSLADALNSLNS